MGIGWLLFSFNGRVNRGRFWLVILIMAVFGFAASMLLATTSANPVFSELRAAEKTCYDIADAKEKQDCIHKNTPTFVDMQAAQDKCAQLTDADAVKECKKQAILKDKAGMRPVFIKMLLTMLPIYLIQLWVAIANQVKRFHDLDKSGWFVLLYFIPLVNVGVLIWQGFFVGTTGTNRFGPDPLKGYVL